MTSSAEIVCEGTNVRLCWPTESELEQIVELLCRPSVRRFGLEDPPLDPIEIWTVHRFRLGHPYTGLLAVRWREDDSLLGAIGWYGWNPDERSLWLGHLVVDPQLLRGVAGRPRHRRQDRVGPALDAGRALCDYVFAEMNASVLLTYHLAGNVRSEAVQRATGFLETSRKIHERPDGSKVEMIFNHLTRERWLAVQRLATPASREGLHR